MNVLASVRLQFEISNLDIRGSSARQKILYGFYLNRLPQRRTQIVIEIFFINSFNILKRHGHSLAMTEEAERIISDWEKANPPTRFGKHEYTFAQYGLSEELIHKQFAEYYSRILEVS